MDRCRWCQVVKGENEKAGCRNCRNYAEAIQYEKDVAELRGLFAVYQSIPWDWRANDDWRSDPYYLRKS